MMGVACPLEEFHDDLQKVLEKKKLQREENPYEVPVLRDRLQYSFLWDRFTFLEADNV